MPALISPSVLGRSLSKGRTSRPPPRSSTAGASRHQRRATPDEPRARVQKAVRPEPACPDPSPREGRRVEGRTTVTTGAPGRPGRVGGREKRAGGRRPGDASSRSRGSHCALGENARLPTMPPTAAASPEEVHRGAGTPSTGLCHVRTRDRCAHDHHLAADCSHARHPLRGRTAGRRQNGAPRRRLRDLGALRRGAGGQDLSRAEPPLVPDQPLVRRGHRDRALPATAARIASITSPATRGASDARAQAG